MKLLICLLAVPLTTLVSVGAMAETDIERSVRERQEALRKVVTFCGTTESTFGSARYVRTQWTGDCQGGKLHGDGTLVYELYDPGMRKTHYRFEQRGLMIEGRQVGPWEILQSSSPVFVGGYVWEDAPVPGSYVKGADGSFRVAQPDWATQRLVAVPTSEPIPAAVVARLLEQARGAGSFQAVASLKVPYQSALLSDLLRRGTVYRAASRAIPAPGSGSVALVLTTRAIASMAAIESLARGVRQWGQQQPAAAVRQAAEQLAAAADPQVFAQGLAGLLREHFKTVVFADDIAAVDRSAIEHILVFDLQFEHDIGTALRELVRGVTTASPLPAPFNFNDSFLPGAPMAGGSFFLLNRDLDVVRAHETAPTRVGFMRPIFVMRPNDTAAANEELAQSLSLMADTLAKSLGRDKYIYIEGTRHDNTAAVTSSLRFSLRAP